MAQRNKRLRGVFRCDLRSDPPEKSERIIYNAFPYLSPKELQDGRAFYFPTICSAYFPPEALDYNWDAIQPFKSRFVHEQTHRVVSDVVATCRIQHLIYYFLGKMMDFLDDDSSCHILIPSFTVQFSNGETSDVLTKLAEEFEDLYFTVSLIQETVANAVQAETESWGEVDPYDLLFNADTRAKVLAKVEARGGVLGPVHRETAKDHIWASLKELCTNDEYEKVVDDFFTGPLIDEFLDVYDRGGMPVAWLLARYALTDP
jgi:hypothetical protein